MNIAFSLLLPRDELSVLAVRRVCGNALSDLGVHPDCGDDIELALTEACTNVLKHARGSSDEYEVSLEITESTCDIRVEDKGTGFSSDDIGDELVNETAEGGRGIHLMKALVDKVSFVSKPRSGTVVHLEKELVCEEGSVLARLCDCSPKGRGSLSSSEGRGSLRTG